MVGDPRRTNASDGSDDSARDPLSIPEHVLKRFAHRARSLLTSISAAADYMLTSDTDESARREMLSIIAEQSGRLDALIDDLVVASSDDQAPAGAMPSVDLCSTARQVVSNLAAEAQSSGAWLVLEGCDCAPPVAGERRALRQAIAGAIRSVLALTRPGDRVLVHVIFDESRQPRPHVRLTVRVTSGAADVRDRMGALSLEELSLDAARRICRRFGGDVQLLPDGAGVTCSIPAAPVQSPPPLAACAGSHRRR